MLERVQDDILNLRTSGDEGAEEVEAGDCSIQVHSCHSPMREVEVLLDTAAWSSPLCSEKDASGIWSLGMCWLWRLISRPMRLLSGPCLTWTGGIRAASLTASRTGRSGGAPSWRMRSWPCSICRRQRFEASLVMDLLDKAPVRARFGMDEEAVRKVHAWVIEAGIRWGRDGRDKEEMGLPGFEENTWGFGLKRLLLGYAMAEGDGLFEGIAPLAGMDPASAELLGSFVDFVERLFAGSGHAQAGAGVGRMVTGAPLRSSTTCSLRTKRPFVSFCG